MATTLHPLTYSTPELQLPFVTIILPIRNEARQIESCLNAIIEQYYPAELLEILVVDGMSTDNTRQVIQEFQKQHPNLILIDNPGRIVPTGLNLAICQARGEIIIRVDGHTLIASDYVRQCVDGLHRTIADNVGGKMSAIGQNAFGCAVAITTSSPFGVGGARFHYSDKEEWVDTVYMGAWHRQIFEKVGLFDEELVRDQDDEFNYRLLDHGGKILLIPGIKSQYTVRSHPGALWRQYFQYGFWKARVLQKHPRQMRLRQFIPLAFSATLLGSICLALLMPFGVNLLALLLGCYLLANLAASIWTSARKGWRYLPFLILVYTILHLSYGLGFLVGLLRFAKRWGNKRGKVPTWGEVKACADSLIAFERKNLDDLPFVTILMPIRNEAKYIQNNLGAVLAQDYPSQLMEVIVIDGMSTDNTRAIVEDQIESHPNLCLFENPGKIVPTGMNIGLAHACGEIILRVDGHTEIAPDYVRQCIEAIKRRNADNVGGRMIPVSKQHFGEAVALATSVPFGIGGGRFHFSDKEEWVDTVYMGAWRREVFDKIGLFDESFARDEDDEFSCRLLKNNGKILLSPEIQSKYTPRYTPGELWSQYFQYGFWKVRVLQKHPRQMRPSQFVPPILMAALLGSILLGILKPFGGYPFMLITGCYFLANLAASIRIAVRKGWKNLSLLPLVFVILHLSYGLGFLAGMIYFFNYWGDKQGKVPVLDKVKASANSTN